MLAQTHTAQNAGNLNSEDRGRNGAGRGRHGFVLCRLNERKSFAEIRGRVKKCLFYMTFHLGANAA